MRIGLRASILRQISCEDDEIRQLWLAEDAIEDALEGRLGWQSQQGLLGLRKEMGVRKLQNAERFPLGGRALG